MEAVYFRTDPSKPAGFAVDNRKIPFTELGQEFRLKPESIKLNGFVFPRDSQSDWEKAKAFFRQLGLPVGSTEDAPVVVTGDPAVPTLPTDLSSIWKEMKGIMEISLLPVKKQLQYTKSKMSRGLNDNFKAALIDYYGVDKIDSPTGSMNAKHHGNRELRCMMTGCMLPRRDVCAAHLIGHSMQDHALKLFGITDIDSPKNGLLVVKPIEEAFDDSRLCFSFHVTRSGFILHVLDASYLTRKLSDHPKLTKPTKRILGNRTFGDLEGHSLQFPNSMRPFKRVLQFQARQAIALASTRGTLPETFSRKQWDFDYGSPGDYRFIVDKWFTDNDLRFIVDKWFTDNDLSSSELEVSGDSGPSHESTSNNESVAGGEKATPAAPISVPMRTFDFQAIASTNIEEAIQSGIADHVPTNVAHQVGIPISES